MKVIIVAAGLGSRLNPLTNDKPKGLLKIKGKSILERQLEILRQCGVRDISIVRGYKGEKINVEFVKTISDQEAVLRVYERGVGVTNSCGTGTCAAVVAGTILGKFPEKTPITVHNDGGDLIITYTGENVFMEGPIERAFKGIVERIEI